MGQVKKFSPTILYPVMLVSGMVLIFPGPILDSLIHKFEISKSVAGRLPFLFFVGGFFGLLFMSELARLIGTKRTFLFALALSSLSLALLGLAWSFNLILPLFFLCGFANNKLPWRSDR